MARKYYYAVAVGRRPGIYKLWKNAKTQVTGYNKAVYKRFSTLKEAQQFMLENRICPPGAVTILPPGLQTPLPPTHLNPEYDFDSHQEEELQPPLIQVAPLRVNQKAFARVRNISQRIVRNTENLVLDPPTFECESPFCGYCTGDPWCQRFLLMKRLYQLNVTLGLEDNVGG